VALVFSRALLAAAVQVAYSPAHHPSQRRVLTPSRSVLAGQVVLLDTSTPTEALVAGTRLSTAALPQAAGVVVRAQVVATKLASRVVPAVVVLVTMVRLIPAVPAHLGKAMRAVILALGMRTSPQEEGAARVRLAATVSRETLSLSAATAARVLVHQSVVRLLPTQAGAALRVLA
jgi:hypothetical protein